MGVCVSVCVCVCVYLCVCVFVSVYVLARVRVCVRTCVSLLRLSLSLSPFSLFPSPSRSVSVRVCVRVPWDTCALCAGGWVSCTSAFLVVSLSPRLCLGRVAGWQWFSRRFQLGVCEGLGNVGICVGPAGVFIPSPSGAASLLG